MAYSGFIEGTDYEGVFHSVKRGIIVVKESEFEWQIIIYNYTKSTLPEMSQMFWSLIYTQQPDNKEFANFIASDDLPSLLRSDRLKNEL